MRLGHGRPSALRFELGSSYRGNCSGQQATSDVESSVVGSPCDRHLSLQFLRVATCVKQLPVDPQPQPRSQQPLRVRRMSRRLRGHLLFQLECRNGPRQPFFWAGIASRLSVYNQWEVIRYNWHIKALATMTRRRSSLSAVHLSSRLQRNGLEAYWLNLQRRIWMRQPDRPGWGMRRVRLELTTYGLKARCSTN